MNVPGFFQPRTVSETSAFLAQHPGAVPIAGGTDLSDKWGNGLLTKLTHLLDLNKTSDLPRFR